jgi:hypothetical protein
MRTILHDEALCVNKDQTNNSGDTRIRDASTKY